MKNRTWIIDVDGVLLKHHGQGAAFQWCFGNEEIIRTSLEQLNALEKEGACIVLMTARPEHLRIQLEAVLHSAGAVWHKLVMGVTSGQRVLVNDNKNDDKPSCFALDIRRNDGLLQEHLDFVNSDAEDDLGTNRCWTLDGSEACEMYASPGQAMIEVVMPCRCSVRVSSQDHHVISMTACKAHGEDNQIGERQIVEQLAVMSAHNFKGNGTYHIKAQQEG